MEKHKLMAAVSQAFEKKIAEMRKVVATSREMTRDAIGRLESRYDTRRVEMGWVTTGLGAALGELEYNYSLFMANSVSSMTYVSNGDCFEAVAIGGTVRLTCFVCQGGSGLECEVDGKSGVVVSPDSPIAVGDGSGRLQRLLPQMTVPICTRPVNTAVAVLTGRVCLFQIVCFALS